MKLTTYLNFGGNCAEAFHFYAEHLGGKVLDSMTHGASPVASNAPPGWEDKIVFATMSLGETLLMGNDVFPDLFKPMRSVYLTLTLKTEQETEHIYNLLRQDGEIYMPLEKQFFSPAFAMLRDKFGVSWMLLCEPQQPTKH